MDPNDWTLTGNAGTDPTTNFLGTTDNQALVIKTNGTEQLRVHSSGEGGKGPHPDVEIAGTVTIAGALGIGADPFVPFTSESTSLAVGGGITTPWAVTFQHSEPSMGENGLRPYLHKAWDGSQGDFLYLGATGDRSNTGQMAMVLAEFQGIKFGTGTDTAGGLNTELMRLTSAGNLGIGTTSPAAKLEVSAASGVGVSGSSNTDTGVAGQSQSGSGVAGQSQSGPGVIGTGATGVGGIGSGPDGTGVRASGSSYGMWVECDSPTIDGTGLVSRFVDQVGTVTGTVALSTFSLAGEFSGDILVHGGVRNSATSSFLIDHPLEPATKFLSHTSVEASEMKTLYDGVVVLDANGEAEVEMPAWFEALNTDFRYQLTPLGVPGPNLYIAEKVHDNRFKIAGGSPQMEVCWCVTGIRQDAWAKTHQLPIEQDKTANEQGYYLHPELYGESEQKSIMHAHYPKLMENPKK